MALDFEWNNRKAASNLKLHAVSFGEAATVFADPLSLTISDPDCSSGETRFIDIGLSHQRRLIVVSYTERGDKIRIISARLASNQERQQYEEAN